MGAEELHERMLAWRGVRDKPCDRCSGSGVRTYGSTATWRGGIGGAAMTIGVCDLCWGSGSVKKPWPSHRRLTAADKLADAASQMLTMARIRPFHGGAITTLREALKEYEQTKGPNND